MKLFFREFLYKHNICPNSFLKLSMVVDHNSTKLPMGAYTVDHIAFIWEEIHFKTLKEANIPS